MKYNKTLICATAVLLTLVMGTAAAQEPIEELGEFLFFDEDLSTPKGQSCATCHDPEWGFTGPDSDINNAGAVYPGAIHTRFGNRKPPTSAYGGDSPVFDYEKLIGGMFWDGRATGLNLLEEPSDPLTEQAMGPFLNPLEQNNPNKRIVCIKVQNSDYASFFDEVYPENPLDCVNDVAGTYERIARSIAAYERSIEVNPFSSKYDAYLDGVEGVDLTEQEALGLVLFEASNNNNGIKEVGEGGNCAECHPSGIGDFNLEHPLFTDFTYDNLGIPKNPNNPFYSMPRYFNPDGMNWVDYGLGGFLLTTDYSDIAGANMGKHKVPTLRNVDKRPSGDNVIKAYGHNGYFKSLKGIVHFYNTRDEPWSGEEWLAPEVLANMNTDELGNLGLTGDDEDAIVAFMKTLSDGYYEPEP
ncbi:MAG TPA: cytochrome c peroxidase [Candidatus Nanoarchaeia archaeon]|nr:cytochrome c peroxidase [Candidatus Nanoarchaeia archaeon]